LATDISTVIRNDFRTGIREEDLTNLCIEIVKYSDDISELFGKVDDDMAEAKEIYKGTSADTLFNSYDDFRKNYAIVKSNINSYSDDLTELINKLRNGLTDLSHLFDSYTEGIKTNTKAIDW